MRLRRLSALSVGFGILLGATNVCAQEHGAMELVEHAAYDYVSHAANQAWLGDNHAGAPKPTPSEKITSLLAFGVGMTWGPFPAASFLGVSKLVRAINGRSRGEVRLGAFRDRPDPKGTAAGHHHPIGFAGALVNLPPVTVRCSGGHSFEIPQMGDPQTMMEMSARLLQVCGAATPAENSQLR